MDKQFIVYGTVAALVLYFVVKSEAGAAVKAVGDVVTKTYEPIKSASSSFGGWLFDVTHPGSKDKRLGGGVRTVNDVRH